MSRFYILDQERNLIGTDDACVWGLWLDEHTQERIVGQDRVGALIVSTVFMGIHPMGKLAVFETAVFSNGRHARDSERHSLSWRDAERAHARAVARELAEQGREQRP